MRDITWLHLIYYTRLEARDEVVIYLHVELSLELEDAKAWEGVMLNASEPKIESLDDKEE